MDPPYSARGFGLGVGGDEVDMSGGRKVPVPAGHNGHRVESLDKVTQTCADDLCTSGGAEHRQAPEMALGGSAEIFSATDEPLRPEPFGRRDDASRRQGDARGLRTAGPSDTETGGRHPGPSGGHPNVEDLLSTVRSYAESLTIQARADADELLSRAHAQAELLRVRAEAVRAEAECLRAEAAALRIAVRDDAEVASERATSAAHTYAAAEELRAGMQHEADAARAEFERMRTEAMAIRRLLRAEVDAGVFDTERMRGEVQRIWAETHRLAAVLSRLAVGTEATGGPVETIIESGTEAGPGRGSGAENLPFPAPEPGSGRLQPQIGGVEPSRGRATGVVGERRRQPSADVSDMQHSAAASRSDDPEFVVERPPEAKRVLQQSVPAPDSDEVQLESNGAELQRRSREVVSAESTSDHRTAGDPISSPGSEGPLAAEPRTVTSGPSPAVEASLPPAGVPAGGEAKRASQPLIGSGGWQQKQAPGARAAPEVPSPTPPASNRRRRRFHRE